MFRTNWLLEAWIPDTIFACILQYLLLQSVLRIRIRMFLGLSEPDPLVRGTDPAPDPDPSIIKQK